MKALKITVMSVIALLALVFLLWNCLPGWLSSKLSDMAKVSVSMSHIDFTPWSIGVDELTIGNPKGYTLKRALGVKEIHIDVPVTHFFHKEVVINRMDMNNVYVGLEFDKKGSTNGNWTVIMNHMGEAGGKKEPKGESKSILIRKLLLTNVNVDLLFRDQGKKPTRLKPIPSIELTNISTSGPFPMEQISHLILDQMLRQIFSIQNLGNMLQNALSPAGKGSDVFGTLKGLFSSAELIEDLKDEIVEGGEEPLEQGIE